ncbi:hypothetical protein [Limnobacter sp.]|uniref:hypothetical protein n=1 Tax=Limnobacter sp. TaxID=2003368 RepID=UPI0035181E4E
MMFDATYCKESKKIHGLNNQFIQLVKHLLWQGQTIDLNEVLNLPAEESKALAALSPMAIEELLSSRATTLFAVEVCETELQTLMCRQQASKTSSLHGVIKYHSALLALAENPARSFLKNLFIELQHWGAFSTNTSYRFSMAQWQIQHIAELDTESLVQLAQSPRSTLRPKFNLAQLNALGKTGLVPAGLLFD